MGLINQRRADAILLQEDLTAIENVLYLEKEGQLMARKLLGMNTSYAAGAKEIGYDTYNRSGSAKIIAHGGKATDVKFVEGEVKRILQTNHTFATGFELTKSEVRALQAKRQIGKGPDIDAESRKIAAVRRFMAEFEDHLVFIGDTEHKVEGLLNVTDSTIEDVASGVGGLLWSLKTPQEILIDLLRAKEVIEGDGFFVARVLVLSPKLARQLDRPFSDQSPITLMNWLATEGAYFDEVIETRALDKRFNEIAGPKEAFMVMDNDAEVAEIVVPQEMELEEPVHDILGNWTFGVTEESAGALIRHPSAIYVGTGI